MPHVPRRPVPTHLVLIFAGLARVTMAQESASLPVFDFRESETVSRWRAAHDVERMTATADGMEVVASGDDPFLVGPAVDLPVGAPLAVEIKVRSERGGTVEVFYFADHAAAGKSVTARVPAGAWETVRLPLPPMGPRMTLRIDPPATKGGKATIASVALRRRMVVALPRWPRPPVAPAAEPRFIVRSGRVSLAHGGAPGGVEVRVENQLMAVGLARSLIGTGHEGQVRWTPLPGRADVRMESGAIVETSSFADADGATWRVERRYRAGPVDGSINVDVTLSVDRDRELVFFPALVLFPGAASFGAGKSQALFCGLEYLGPNDASRSEADVIGPASRRLVPDSLKVTAPLMAVCAGGRYVGLRWETRPHVAALFDSPDRTFGSGGHALGLILPGSDGRTRIDGELLPEMPFPVRAGEPLSARATILGDQGASVVPAVRQYLEIGGLPEVPRTGMDAQGYYRFAAGGWLDSKIRQGALVRHAVWPGFGAQHAADAAVWMKWLAAQSGDAALATRLDKVAKDVAGAVPPEQYDSAAVGHVRYPVASLVFGHAEENAARAAERGKALTSRFEADGSFRYVRDPRKEDFARTNPAPTSNGLTATQVVRVLEAAAVSGDDALLRRGIELLHGLDRYEHDVPRGAQSWEVPLHTPDVLASAMLVRAYLWGYELTGERRMLELAEYWAWTGVPFVYLRNPADAPVGPYATIAVYGATNWAEPVWFGRPVQWCGLVYTDALYRLAEARSQGPWKRLADGITASAVGQCWPATDALRQGLLPDFYHLRAQASDGPAINPATVQAGAVRLFGGPVVYDFCRFPTLGLLVHAPGHIEPLAAGDNAGRDAAPDAARFRVGGWPDGPYSVLLSGARRPLHVRVNGTQPQPQTIQHDLATGRMVLQLSGTATVELSAERP
jgi:hypothetical protein